MHVVSSERLFFACSRWGWRMSGVCKVRNVAVWTAILQDIGEKDDSCQRHFCLISDALNSNRTPIVLLIRAEYMTWPTPRRLSGFEIQTLTRRSAAWMSWVSITYIRHLQDKMIRKWFYRMVIGNEVIGSTWEMIVQFHHLPFHTYQS